MGYINITIPYLPQCLLKDKIAILGLDSAKHESMCLNLSLFRKALKYIPSSIELLVKQVLWWIEAFYSRGWRLLSLDGDYCPHVTVLLLTL